MSADVQAEVLYLKEALEAAQQANVQWTEYANGLTEEKTAPEAELAALKEQGAAAERDLCGLGSQRQFGSPSPSAHPVTVHALKGSLIGNDSAGGTDNLHSQAAVINVGRVVFLSGAGVFWYCEAEDSSEVTDAAGDVLICSVKAAEVLEEYEQSEVIGKALIDELMRPAYKEEAEQGLGEVVEGWCRDLGELFLIVRGDSAIVAPDCSDRWCTGREHAHRSIG